MELSRFPLSLEPKYCSLTSWLVAALVPQQVVPPNSTQSQSDRMVMQGLPGFCLDQQKMLNRNQ